MFNLLHFIEKIKQAIFLKLIHFSSLANQRHLPTIKPQAFLVECNPKKLSASNDHPQDIKS